LSHAIGHFLATSINSLRSFRISKRPFRKKLSVSFRSTATISKKFNGGLVSITTRR
jgi:hypothetical protein